jgi:uncharacterized protein
MSAEWRKLILVNYAIDPALLQDALPVGTELDIWEGKCYVSLVGFMFKEVRLKGIKIPFHHNFEEVNLRFYVRRFENNEWKRGVAFISEIVPKIAITLVANTLYGEKYSTKPMRHQWITNPDTSQDIVYEWKHRGKWQHLSVQSSLTPIPISIGSEEEFITEHYWGYTHRGDKRTGEFEVRHPRWLTYPIISYLIEADFGALYGDKFAFLKNIEPTSVMLAEGSEIEVMSSGDLRF